MVMRRRVAIDRAHLPATRGLVARECILEHDAVGRGHTQARGGEQIALGIGFTRRDVAGRHQNRRDREAGGSETSRRELGAGGRHYRPAIGRQAIKECLGTRDRDHAVIGGNLLRLDRLIRPCAL